MSSRSEVSAVNIDNICRRCRVLTGKKPCDKPCSDWHKLLNAELKKTKKGVNYENKH